jgi:hypothetical protein
MDYQKFKQTTCDKRKRKRGNEDKELEISTKVPKADEATPTQITTEATVTVASQKENEIGYQNYHVGTSSQEEDFIEIVKTSRNQHWFGGLWDTCGYPPLSTRRDDLDTINSNWLSGCKMVSIFDSPRPLQERTLKQWSKTEIMNLLDNLEDIAGCGSGIFQKINNLHMQNEWYNKRWCRNELDQCLGGFLYETLFIEKVLATKSFTCPYCNNKEFQLPSNQSQPFADWFCSSCYAIFELKSTIPKKNTVKIGDFYSLPSNFVTMLYKRAIMEGHELPIDQDIINDLAKRANMYLVVVIRSYTVTPSMLQYKCYPLLYKHFAMQGEDAVISLYAIDSRQRNWGQSCTTMVKLATHYTSMIPCQVSKYLKVATLILNDFVKVQYSNHEKSRQQLIADVARVRTTYQREIEKEKEIVLDIETQTETEKEKEKYNEKENKKENEKEKDREKEKEKEKKRKKMKMMKH